MNGLRDYGTGTWEGGDAAGCDHQSPNGQGATGQRADRTFTANQPYKELCGKCGARRIDRQIGLEPDPETYLATMVGVFREVRRVLRDDGILWLNVGDSMSAGGNGPGNGKQLTNPGANMPPRSTPGLPAKNLMMMPARLAIALQADGWFLRSMLPWLKRSAMPESVTDRPASAVEYVFLLTKSARYFWDAEAVRRQAAYGYVTYPEATGRSDRKAASTHMWRNVGDGESAVERGRNNRGASNDPSAGRNMRNSDLFYDSLEDAPEPPPKHFGGRSIPRDGAAYGPFAKRDGVFRGGSRAPGGSYPLPNNEPLGLICDAAGEPLALDVNPAAYPGSHFATFAPKLIEPLIRAGTSERGCCAACGAPWVRCVEPDLTNVPTRLAKHRAPVDTEAVAAYLRERRVAVGLSGRAVDEALGTNTLYSWFEGRKAGIEAPTPEQYTKLKSILGLDDRFDEQIYGEVDVVVTDHTPEKAPGVRTYGKAWNATRTTTGWAASCACQAETRPCVVLDPFAGASTTLLVADRLQRDAIGIELNPDYVSMSESRVVDDAPLLAWLAEAAE